MKQFKIIMLLFLVSLIVGCGSSTHEKDAEQQGHHYTPHKKIDIDKVMNYPMHEQIKRHRKDYNVDLETALFREREFKRWLLIAQDEDDDFPMFSDEVDAFWHTLLLYTKEYATFCNECFGQFIHHAPEKVDDRELE